MANVCGKKCEVYSRIVGYFRPIQNWNAGKAEEFKFRKEFSEQKAVDESNLPKTEEPAVCK